MIWILQWVALSGWLLSYLGLPRSSLGLGATLGSAACPIWGFGSPARPGIIITSILNAFVAMIILASGFKNYVRFQHVMMVWHAACLRDHVRRALHQPRFFHGTA